MKKIFFFILIGLALGSQISYAQSNQYTLLEPLPCIAGTGNNCTSGQTIPTINFETYIEYIFKFSIALAVFLAVIMIIIGGFEYMVSEAPFAKTNAKSRITNAIVGLLGALISYLILLTIDPRLVQVNSQLPPVNIDTTEIENFQKRFATNIRELSLEAQLQVNEDLAQKKQMETDLKEINYKINNDQSLTPQEREELKVKRAALEQKIGNLNVNINKNMAMITGQKFFTETLDLLKQSDAGSKEDLKKYTANTVPNVLVNGKYPTNSPNLIQNSYNEKINKVLKNSDGQRRTEAQKIAEIQILEKQRDFYIREIKEEVDLTNQIKSRQLREGSLSTWKENTEKLNSLKNRYQTRLTNHQLNTQNDSVEISTKEYTQLMQARITEIDKALTIKHPLSK